MPEHPELRDEAHSSEQAHEAERLQDSQGSPEGDIAVDVRLHNQREQRGDDNKKVKTYPIILQAKEMVREKPERELC